MIKELIDKEIENVKEKCPKIYSKELVESLFNQPYCRISTLETSLNITRFTASKYLKELENIGLLKGEKMGRDMLRKQLQVTYTLRQLKLYYH